MLKKLFPVGVGNGPLSSFKLIIVAEGYRAADTAQFTGDCVDLVEGLLRITPFNLTRARPAWLSVYSSFTPSANAGPSIDAPAAAGRTAFETSYSTTTRLLAPSQAKVNAWAAAETFLLDGANAPLAEYVASGARSYGPASALIVLLLPSIPGQPQGGEVESTPAPGDTHFVAVSKDGRYAQLVARSIARALGLGDEFELPGPDYLAPPDDGRVLGLHYNLEGFAAGPPNPLDGRAKWSMIMSPVAKTLPPVVHAKTDGGAAPDTTLDDPPATATGIEFWEGGGGYRTKVWRSAHDCIMRRRIGDASLPLRAGPVPFCPACRRFLDTVIW